MSTDTVKSAPVETSWFQKKLQLPSVKRGCHVVTKHIYNGVPEIGQFEIGLANIFSECAGAESSHTMPGMHTEHLHAASLSRCPSTMFGCVPVCL